MITKPGGNTENVFGQRHYKEVRSRRCEHVRDQALIKAVICAKGTAEQILYFTKDLLNI